MSKQFFAVLAAIIIVFVGIFAVSNNKSNSGSKTSKSGSLSQHFIGSKTSGVTLTEYGDFQCPYCEAYYPVVKQVTDEFKDQIQFQFRNYPLTNAHPNAFAAARASEAAGKQNKFWEMYDSLYDSNNYQSWTTAKDPTPEFNTYAQALGLNLAKFKTDFGSIAVNDTINADMAEGNKIGITGTPSFYINGKATQIANNADAFRKAIKAAIAKQPKSKTTTAAPATTPSTDTTAQTPAATQ